MQHHSFLFILVPRGIMHDTVTVEPGDLFTFLQYVHAPKQIQPKDRRATTVET